MDDDSPRHTCLKLNTPEPIFVKGTWFPSRFQLAVTDGSGAWTCDASEEEVDGRSSQWDQPVTEYIDLAERHLGFQQPGSVYGFSDAGNGSKRLSWTFEKEGIKLEWRWKCQPADDSKKTTADIMDFLMDANIRLSDEVVDKTQAFERLRIEAEKCLAQSEQLSKEKEEFENEIYAKFLVVLNSKKSKLRELRDQLSKQKGAKELPEEPEEEEASTDKTESYDEKSEEEDRYDEDAGTSSKSQAKPVSTSRGRGRKRK